MGYSRSTVTVCKATRNLQVCHSKIKLDRPFCEIVQGFLKVFLSNVLRFISCVNALNFRIARINLGRGSVADVEISPVAANFNSVELRTVNTI